MFYVEEPERKDRAMSKQPVTLLPIFFHFALHNADNAAMLFYVVYGWLIRAL